MKSLFEKCNETGLSEFQALLDWRNTPCEGTAPYRPSMPYASADVRISFTTKLFTARWCACVGWRERRQKNYYDRHAKFLKPISLGETCACKASRWESVVSCHVRGLRGSSHFPCKDWWCCRRRNRRDLLSTGKTPVTDQSDLPVTAQSSRSNAELPGAHFPAPDTPKSSACESDTL